MKKRNDREYLTRVSKNTSFDIFFNSTTILGGIFESSGNQNRVSSAATTYKFCITHHILTKHLNVQFKRLQITNPYTFGNETLHKNTWSFHQCSQVHPQAQPNQITQQKSLSLLLKIKGYHNKKLHHYSLAIVTPSFTILG